MEIRDRIKLKFWMAAGELARLGQAIDGFYDAFQQRLEQLSGQIDPETAPLALVDLLAWERDIERMAGEDDALFRKRVKYALANAKDAGSKAGFARIWQRLGLGEITQTERFDPGNWDVIRLRMDESMFGHYVELLDSMIRQYGRTCRRYEFESIAVTPLGVRPFNFDCDIFNCKAVL